MLAAVAADVVAVAGNNKKRGQMRLAPFFFILLAMCPLTGAQQKPVIKADRSRLQVAEILYVTGTGFTPGGAAVSHLIRPDKTEYNPLRLRANAAGELVHKIDTVMLDTGTFEMWIEDEIAKASSNHIQFAVDSDLRER